MDLATELCSGASLAFALGGCGYYYVSKGRKKQEVVVDGPAPGSRVRSIVVHAGSFVDRVDFVFSDGFVASFGGDGGTRLVDFVLEEGETVVCVRGRSGSYVDSMQFVLSSGRVSPIYGGTGGSTPYNFDIGEAIGGLRVIVSVRGWLGRVSGVVSVVDMEVPTEVAHTARNERHEINLHQIKHHVKVVVPERRRYLLFLFIIVLFYLGALFPVVLLWICGGMTLETWMDKVAAPSVAEKLEHVDLWKKAQVKQSSGEGGSVDTSSLINEVLRGVVRKQGGFVKLPGFPKHDREDNTWQVSGEWREFYFSRGHVEHQWFMIPFQDKNDKMFEHQSMSALPSNLILVKTTRESIGQWSMVYWSERLALFVKQMFAKPFSLSFPLVDDIADDVGGSEHMPYLRYGMVRVFQMSDWGQEGDEHDHAKMPIFYVDTSFQPWILLVTYAALQIVFTFIVVELCLLAFGSARFHPVYSSLAGYVSESITLEDVIEEIEMELSDVEHVAEVKWGQDVIKCSANWLVVFRRFSLEAVRMDDVRVESFKLVLRYMGSEPIEVTVMKIARYLNGYVRRFTLECPRNAFPVLRQAILVQRRETALQAVKVQLEAYLQVEWRLSQPRNDPPTEACLGECGAFANVRISKRCTTCEERDECRCEPMWCHRCLLKWWIEKNTTKLEMGIPPTLAWQTRCPTCRVFFCLKDLEPVGPVNPSNQVYTHVVSDLPLSTQVPQGVETREEEEEEEDDDDETARAIALSLSMARDRESDLVVDDGNDTSGSVEDILRSSTQGFQSTSVAESGLTEGSALESASLPQDSTPSANELRRLRLARFENH